MIAHIKEMTMRAIKFGAASVLLFVSITIVAGHARADDTQITGIATSSSFTFTGPVSFSTLTVSNLTLLNGKQIFQIKFASSTTTTSTTGTSYTSVLSVSAQASSSSHSFIVIAVGNITNTDVADDGLAAAALFRDSTNITSGTTHGTGVNRGQVNFEGGLSATGRLTVPATLLTYDSPGDTSSHTYAVKISNADAVGTVYWNILGSCSYIMVIEVG